MLPNIENEKISWQPGANPSLIVHPLCPSPIAQLFSSAVGWSGLVCLQSSRHQRQRSSIYLSSLWAALYRLYCKEKPIYVLPEKETAPASVPISTFMFLWGIYINYLCTCDLYSPVHNVLDGCTYIMWGSGRGLGPGIPEFFGPQKFIRNQHQTVRCIKGHKIPQQVHRTGK